MTKEYWVFLNMGPVSLITVNNRFAAAVGCYGIWGPIALILFFLFYQSVFRECGHFINR